MKAFYLPQESNMGKKILKIMSLKNKNKIVLTKDKMGVNPTWVKIF